MKWQVKQIIAESAQKEFPEIPALILQILFNRGLTEQSAIDQFLSPDYSRDVLDPYLFRDMSKACDRIYQAIDNGEIIAIHGDYDADGVSASAILHLIISGLGGKTTIFIPHREKDGYGLNTKTVDYLHSVQAKVIITCDCGISNAPEVELANKLNMQVIITDHHQIPDVLPTAYAIIHPKIQSEPYPFKELAGGGVAFKLAQGLLHHAKSPYSANERESKEKWLLDLVALSSIADMVYLTGENRVLVQYGLVVMKKNQRMGLAKLFLQANIDPEKIDARVIGYQIAPRINAAGRMDHANASYLLLTEQDADKATILAQQLGLNNIDRQKQTEIIYQQALGQYDGVEQPILFFHHPDWPLGLVGLVAGKLVKHFNRPCFVSGFDGEKIVASGRSIEGYNILLAVKKCQKLLLSFGGHPQACGMRLASENYEQIKTIISQDAEQALTGHDFQPELSAEADISFDDIDWTVADYLLKFVPYGQGNEQPMFITRQVEIVRAAAVGKKSDHLKLQLRQTGRILPAIAFGYGQSKLQVGGKIDILYTIEINQWNGNREIQLNIKDLKHD